MNSFGRQCKSKSLVNIVCLIQSNVPTTFLNKDLTMLLEAHKSGMDIIIKEGLANGRALNHPKLIELSQTLDCETDQLALAAILAQPFQPRVLSGSVTSAQLRSNLGSLYSIDGNMSVSERLVSTAEGKEVLQQLKDSCKMESKKYWNDRSALKWN